MPGAALLPCCELTSLALCIGVCLQAGDSRAEEASFVLKVRSGAVVQADCTPIRGGLSLRWHARLAAPGRPLGLSRQIGGVLNQQQASSPGSPRG